ncbi:hypothetical protein Dsin_015056 [Dipteronia sinensis]|uniref:RNase H type-1 domain-containing protein n=1 Tax=Dipteronia sinensis TaxID=43782 RepID=A0AAE0AN40_9ROSI|nr:hypothetical protein Dsin_015056 [Dipteronia sinensis]
MRSRSGAPAMSLPKNHACNINNSFNSTSQRFVNNRSKSTTRTRNQKNNNNDNDEENVNPSSMQKNKEGSKDGFVRFLQRGSGPRSTTTTPAAAAKNNNKVTKSVTNSPSAWALSPGRTSPCMVAPESPAVTSRVVKVKSSSGGGGGVSGVLKYFRQKKVSPIQEEEYRNFRVVHNRLVQYRFANARAEATMASLNNVAQKKLFSGWLRVLKMRNLILEKQIQVEKLKHEIKLCQIVNPQMRLLNEWTKIEGKNFEAVGRVTRKLSAISVKIPFDDDDTKADVESVYKAMSTAVQVMNGIEETITKFFPQAEKILYMVTELASTLEQEDEYLKELDTIIPQIPTLLVPPGEGFVKLNVDGGRIRDVGTISTGGVVCDHLRSWLGDFVLNKGIGTVIEAELWGLFEGLDMVWRRGFRKVVVENDSMFIVHFIEKDTNPNQSMFSLIQSCKRLIISDWNCIVKYVYREGNMADELAKMGCNMEFGVLFFEEPPPDILWPLLIMMIGVLFVLDLILFRFFLFLA